MEWISQKRKRGSFGDMAVHQNSYSRFSCLLYPNNTQCLNWSHQTARTDCRGEASAVGLEGLRILSVWSCCIQQTWGVLVKSTRSLTFFYLSSGHFLLSSLTHWLVVTKRRVRELFSASFILTTVPGLRPRTSSRDAGTFDCNYLPEAKDSLWSLLPQLGALNIFFRAYFHSFSKHLWRFCSVPEVKHECGWPGGRCFGRGQDFCVSGNRSAVKACILFRLFLC